MYIQYMRFDVFIVSIEKHANCEIEREEVESEDTEMTRKGNG